MREGVVVVLRMWVGEGSRQTFPPSLRMKKTKTLSHVEDDGQRRREGASVPECQGNVQGDHFDADGHPVAAAGGRGEEVAGPAACGQDDTVALSEGDQQQVVQAS